MFPVSHELVSGIVLLQETTPGLRLLRRRNNASHSDAPMRDRAVFICRPVPTPPPSVGDAEATINGTYSARFVATPTASAIDAVSFIIHRETNRKCKPRPAKAQCIIQHYFSHHRIWQHNINEKVWQTEITQTQ